MPDSSGSMLKDPDVVNSYDCLKDRGYTNLTERERDLVSQAFNAGRKFQHDLIETLFGNIAMCAKDYKNRNPIDG